MADPYANLANSFNDMTRNLLTLKGQSMQNALSEAELAMRGNQFMETQRQNDIQNYGMPRSQVAPGTPTLQEREMRVRESALPKTPQHQKNFGSIAGSTAKNELLNYGVSKDNPIMDDIKSLVDDPTVNNYQAYQMLKQRFPEYREAMVEEMADNYVKMAEKYEKEGKDYRATPEGKRHNAILDALDADPTGDTILGRYFSGTLESYNMEQENTRAALEGQRSAERVALSNPETQYIINKTATYTKAGMPREKATVKAYEDLSNIRARQAREGRVNVSLNAASGGQVDTLAKGILDGTIDPNGISKRGGLQAAVWAKVKEYDPKFNLVEAGVSAKFKGSTATMQTKALLNTIDPLLDQLDMAGAVLGNSNIMALNKARNFLKEQTGSDDIVGFNNLRDAVVAEVERGLMGTGVLSDNKYQRELKNINSAQNYKQLQAAIKNTRMVIRARLEAIDAGPNTKPTWKKEENSAPKKIGRFTVEEE